MKIELDFLHALQGLHNPIFDRIMLFITRLGDGNFIWLLISISMILLPPIKKVFNKEYDDEYMNNVRKRRNVGVTIIIALLLSIILVNICMKPLFGRLRPFQVDSTFQVDTDSVSVQKLGDSSFPSGHTSAAFAAAIAIFLNKKKAGMVAIILACLIAFSRMYFFVHFPTDIIGGVVAGIICGKVASVFVEKMDKQIY
ncbi:MAG: phosphatase PAP2 family protein [Lachnospiraceae bacterium]|nr:phosphatase PAP2 family protein [Lachnospiraceae bacterium]